MKPLDLTSLLVAGVVGAGLMYLYAISQPTTPNDLAPAKAAMLGFGVGLGVQIAVRLTGVS